MASLPDLADDSSDTDESVSSHSSADSRGDASSTSSVENEHHVNQDVEENAEEDRDPHQWGFTRDQPLPFPESLPDENTCWLVQEAVCEAQRVYSQSCGKDVATGMFNSDMFMQQDVCGAFSRISLNPPAEDAWRTMSGQEVLRE
jgi:hypothetical protein